MPPRRPQFSSLPRSRSPELRDRIFDEFNSLAVVYQAPSSTFLQETPQEEVGKVAVSGLPEAGTIVVSKFPDPLWRRRVAWVAMEFSSVAAGCTVWQKLLGNEVELACFEHKCCKVLFCRLVVEVHIPSEQACCLSQKQLH